MQKSIVAVVVAAALQTAQPHAQGGNAALDAAAKALGASKNLTTLQFSATGTNNAYGQAWKADMPWPAFKIFSYTATFDYATPAMRIDLQRSNPDTTPVRGGGGWLRHFAFPILFFLVALPWPVRFEQIVIQDLMRAVTAINVIFLQLAGVPALQHGNVIEIGSGFAGTALTGSEHNDAYEMRDGQVHTRTNNSGGIQGGISIGEPLLIRIAFKPTATIAQAQETVTDQGEAAILEAKGRHDPCVLPRAVPMVEAMVALVLADHYLRQRGQCGA